MTYFHYVTWKLAEPAGGPLHAELLPAPRGDRIVSGPPTWEEIGIFTGEIGLTGSETGSETLVAETFGFRPRFFFSAVVTVELEGAEGEGSDVDAAVGRTGAEMRNI